MNYFKTHIPYIKLQVFSKNFFFASNAVFTIHNKTLITGWKIVLLIHDSKTSAMPNYYFMNVQNKMCIDLGWVDNTKKYLEWVDYMKKDLEWIDIHSQE